MSVDAAPPPKRPDIAEYSVVRIRRSLGLWLSASRGRQELGFGDVRPESDFNEHRRHERAHRAREASLLHPDSTGCTGRGPLNNSARSTIAQVLFCFIIK